MKVLRFEVKYFNIRNILKKLDEIRMDLGKSGKLEIFGKIWKIWNSNEPRLYFDMLVPNQYMLSFAILRACTMVPRHSA